MRTTRIDARLVCRWLLLAAWPMHIGFAAIGAATVALGTVTQQSAIIHAVLVLSLHYAFGLGASFALHELGHLVLLSRARGVSSITLERSLWRLSISSHGEMRDRDAVVAALAGPGACIATGAALWLLAPDLQLHGWYLAHAAFLLPCFADGRTVYSIARSRRQTRPARSE